MIFAAIADMVQDVGSGSFLRMVLFSQSIEFVNIEFTESSLSIYTIWF